MKSDDLPSGAGGHYPSSLPTEASDGSAESKSVPSTPKLIPRRPVKVLTRRLLAWCYDPVMILHRGLGCLRRQSERGVIIR